MDDSERLMLTIKRLNRKVNSIHVDAEEWDDFSEMDKVTYSLEWDNDMGSLKALERSYRAGDMTREQAKTYSRLKDDFRRALSVLERLDLQRPGIGEELP